MSILFGPDPIPYSNGALSTVASSSYSTLTSETSLNVSGNHLVPSAFNVDNANYVNATALATVPDDQWFQATILNPMSSSGFDGSGIGVELRMSTSARTCYRLLCGNTAITFAKFTAGTYSGVLASATGLTIAAGDVFYGEIQGTTIIIQQNGVQRLSTTDSSIATGRFGPGHSSDSAGTPQLDDLSGGDFDAAVPPDYNPGVENLHARRMI